MLLLAVVGGITVVSGAMIGALLLVAMPQVAADYPSLNNLMILLPGLVGHHAWLATPTASRATCATRSAVCDAHELAAAAPRRARLSGVDIARAASCPSWSACDGPRHGRRAARRSTTGLGFTTEDCNGAA